MTAGSFQAAVVGCSAGGLEALHRLLDPLPADFPLPLVVVAHLSANSDSLLPQLLQGKCRLKVLEAEDKMPVVAGSVYVGPPGYHLLVEADHTLSLSVDEKVCHVRPAIDVLFRSAADVWGDGLVAILLTGANRDGTAGLRAVKQRGGLCLVQDPATAVAETMPRSAIAAGLADQVLPLDEISRSLQRIAPSRAKKGKLE